MRHSSCNRVFMYFAFSSYRKSFQGHYFVFLLPSPLSYCVKHALLNKLPSLWTMPGWTTKLPTGSSKVALLYSRRTIQSVILHRVRTLLIMCSVPLGWDCLPMPRPLRLQLLHWLCCSCRRWVVLYPLVSRLKSRIIFGRGYSQMGTFRWIALSHVLPHVCVLCLV